MATQHEKLLVRWCADECCRQNQERRLPEARSVAGTLTLKPETEHFSEPDSMSQTLMVLSIEEVPRTGDVGFLRADDGAAGQARTRAA